MLKHNGWFGVGYMCIAVPESPVNDLLSNDNGHSADYRQAGHLMGNAEMVLPCACSVQRIAGARCAIVNCVGSGGSRLRPRRMAAAAASPGVQSHSASLQATSSQAQTKSSRLLPMIRTRNSQK